MMAVVPLPDSLTALRRPACPCSSCVHCPVARCHVLQDREGDSVNCPQRCQFQAFSQESDCGNSPALFATKWDLAALPLLHNSWGVLQER